MPSSCSSAQRISLFKEKGKEHKVADQTYAVQQR